MGRWRQKITKKERVGWGEVGVGFWRQIHVLRCVFVGIEYSFEK